MKVFIYLMLILIVVVMPIAVALDYNTHNNKTIILPTEKPSENCTETPKVVIINQPPSQKNTIIDQTYKFNYKSMDNNIMSLGNTVPDIKLDEISDNTDFYGYKISENKTLSLLDLRGKKIIINFWASWCDPCKVEFPAFQKFYEEDKNVVILMINVEDTSSSAQKFIAENNYTMPVVYNSDKNISYNFNLNGIPRTLLIDEKGIVKKIKIGSFMPGNGEFEYWVNN